MAEAFIQRLTPQSTLAELPAYGLTLDVKSRGKEAGRLFESDPDLPGIVVTESDRVRFVLSRGQYLRLVSRNFGHEVFDPRPIQLMLDTLDADDEPLILEDRTQIQEAVGRALRRPRALIYEPIVVRSSPSSGRGIAVVDFPDLLRADSRISALRNTQMEQILATVEEGFMMVDGEGRIATERSASVGKIFGADPKAGMPLPDFLEPLLGQEKAELCKGYLATLFNPNVIEKLVADINPLLRAQVQTRNGTTKFLRFRFVRGLENGSIQRILVKIEDVSREVELEEERRAEELRAQERIGRVFEVVRAEPGPLAAFVRKLSPELKRIKQWLDPEIGDLSFDDRLAHVYRTLHGLKGEAGLVGLDSFQRKAHLVEQQLSSARQSSELEVATLEQLRSGLGELESAQNEIRSAIEQLRGLGAASAQAEPRAEPRTPHDSQTASPGRPAGKTAQSAGSNGGSRTGAAHDSRAASTASTDGRPVNGREVLPFWDGMPGWIEKMSQRMGKSARFYTEAKAHDMPARYRSPLRDVLIQLVRNSIVHGLEAPELRRKMGKPAIATLQLAIRRHEDRGQLEVIFQDDGRGLDWQRIAERAQQLGLSARSRAELSRSIFAAGFSTAGQTDLDAGRGVGLDLVKTKLEGLGGSIHAHSEPGAFCAFQILLPI